MLNKSHLIVLFWYAVFFKQWLISSNVFNQKTTRRRWRENIIHAAQEQTQPAFCDSSQPSIKRAQNVGPVYNKQIYLDHNNKLGCVPSRASLHNSLIYLVMSVQNQRSLNWSRKCAKRTHRPYSSREFVSLELNELPSAQSKRHLANCPMARSAWVRRYPVKSVTITYSPVIIYIELIPVTVSLLDL